MYSYVQIKAKLEHSVRSVYFSNFFQFLQVNCQVWHDSSVSRSGEISQKWWNFASRCDNKKLVVKFHKTQKGGEI